MMMWTSPQLARLAFLSAIILLFAFRPQPSQADGLAVEVQLDISRGGPRTVENATEHRIVSDYRLAWASIAQSMESNTQGPMQALFVGPAEKWLTESIISQQKSGLTTRYLNQNHKLQVVFYSPEGDVIELRDTAHYEIQVLDAGKVIHDDNGTHYYVVLMTPGADRWVIRQLLAVPQF